MKKIFANPEIEIKEFAVENIVTTSVGTADSNVNADNASLTVDLKGKDVQWTF